MAINNRDLAAIFDMDGVIIDDNLYHKQAWIEFCKKYHFFLSEDDFNKYVYGRTNKDILSFLFNRELTLDDIHKYAGEKEAIFRELYKPHIKLPDGLFDLLNELKSNGVKMAVATSAPKENIDFVFKNLNIKSFFEIIIDESKVINNKPAPDIYLKTSKLLGVEPGNCIVFEDSISGINAALNAGMTVVAIATTYHEKDLKDATFIIKTFKEINLKKLMGMI